MADEQNFYELLNIPRDVACDRIPKVRAALSRIYHPDSDVVHDEERLKQINNACDILEDPERRKGYDEELEREERATASGGGTPSQTYTRTTGTESTTGGPPPPPRKPSASQEVSDYIPRPPGSPTATTPRPSEASKNPRNVNLAPLLLPLLGLVLSIAVLAALASSPHINNPSFGQAIIGFGCVVVFWASVVKTLKAVANLFRSS